MVAEELKTKIREAFTQAFEQGKMESLDALCAPEMVDHSAWRDPNAVKGRAGFEQRIQGNRTAFPDIKIKIENMIAEDDFLAFNWAISGTNTGSMRGRPPAGKPATFTGMNLERFENGVIIEHWSNPDLLGMMQQLGFIPG